MISQGIWAYSIDFTIKDNTNWTSSKVTYASDNSLLIFDLIITVDPYADNITFDSGDYIDSNNNKGSEYIWDNYETIVNNTIQQARDDKWFNIINGLTDFSDGWTGQQWVNINDLDANIKNIEWRRRSKLKLPIPLFV